MLYQIYTKKNGVYRTFRFQAGVRSRCWCRECHTGKLKIAFPVESRVTCACFTRVFPYRRKTSSDTGCSPKYAISRSGLSPYSTCGLDCHDFPSASYLICTLGGRQRRYQRGRPFESYFRGDYGALCCFCTYFLSSWAARDPTVY